MVYENLLFSDKVNAALTMLIESYKFHGVDAKSILHRMDQKKHIRNQS